jgi:hypothetical protein
MKKIILILSLLVIGMFLIGCAEEVSEDFPSPEEEVIAKEEGLSAGEAKALTGQADRVSLIWTSCTVDQFGTTADYIYGGQVGVEQFNDQCTRGSYLIEYFCQGNKVDSTFTKCDNGCEDAKCVGGEHPYIIEEDFGVIDYVLTKDEEGETDANMGNNPGDTYMGGYYGENLFAVIQVHENPIDLDEYVELLYEIGGEEGLDEEDTNQGYAYCTDDESDDDFTCTWVSNNIFVGIIIDDIFQEIIDDNDFGSDYEDLIEAYLEKFPSTIMESLSEVEEIEEAEEEVVAECDSRIFDLVNGDVLGDTVDDLTQNDLPYMLANGIVKIGNNNYPYHQALTLEHSNAEISYLENDDDESDNYFFFADDSKIATYVLDFNSLLTASLSGSSFDDLVGAKIKILGKTYTITGASKPVSDSPSLALTLQSGNQILALRDNNVNDESYDYGVIVIDDGKSDENNKKAAELEGTEVYLGGSMSDNELKLDKIIVVMKTEDDFYVKEKGTLTEAIKEQGEAPLVLFTGGWDIKFKKLHSSYAGIEVGTLCESGNCVNNVCFTVASNPCSTTDGFDYYVKGNTKGYLTTQYDEIVTKEDACVLEKNSFAEAVDGSNMLHETGCSNENPGVISHSFADCECENGVCVGEIVEEEVIEEESLCTDTDGGEKYYMKGTLKGFLSNGQPATVTDYCNDGIDLGAKLDKGDYLSEYYCFGNKGHYFRKNYLCPGGCEEGVCIEEEVESEASGGSGSSAMDLSDYPEMFIIEDVFNGYIVIGENSGALENLAMADIISSLGNQGYTLSDAAKLDSEISDIYAQNLIVVGNSCINTVAAKLSGNPIDCTTGFSPGKAKVKLFKSLNYAGEWYYAMLVAGYSGADTRLAAKVVANKPELLTGMEVEIEGITWTDAEVNAVE